MNHDLNDPLAELHKLEAAALAVHLPPCVHCHDTRTPVPMDGNAWGVETTHEGDCPLHEDNQPAAEPDSAA